MLRLPAFRLRTPRSVAEAASMLAGEGGETRVVAGGTDLWPNMKRRHQRADVVVALGGVRELDGVRVERDGTLRMGAMTRLSAVAASAVVREGWPALATAVASISSPLLRNMGTIGGNLCLDTRCTYYNQTEEWRRSIDYCMKAEGQVCWVAPGSPRCWAVSSSDAAPILCAMGARVRLVSAGGGEREIAVAELYHDDGIAYLTKRREEILAEVIVPPMARGARASFWKLRRRGSIDFAVLTVAPVVHVDSAGTVTSANLYLGAVNSYPTPARDVAARLVGKRLTAETIREAAQVARKDATPMDNTDFVARWRGQTIAAYVEAALREVAGLPQERAAPRH